MQIRLVPIGFIFSRFTRMVRDLARQQNKEVDLYTEGDNIEVDRSLIDEISESLAHLIKNAIDHGLESPKVRLAAKKPAAGIIKLTAAREKDSLIIEVSDDGGGLDLKGIKKKALQQNMVVPKTTSQEVANIIFEGLSTADRVTSISGRGLGMSIVKKK